MEQQKGTEVCLEITNRERERERDLDTCNLSKTKVAAHIEFPQEKHSLPSPQTLNQTAFLTYPHPPIPWRIFHGVWIS